MAGGVIDLDLPVHFEELPTHLENSSFIDRFAARFDYRTQPLAVEAFLDEGVWTVSPYPGVSIIQGKYDDTGTVHRYAELVFIAGEQYSIEDDDLYNAMVAAGYTSVGMGL